jgi:hypothetical protein
MYNRIGPSFCDYLSSLLLAKCLCLRRNREPQNISFYVEYPKRNSNLTTISKCCEIREVSSIVQITFMFKRIQNHPNESSQALYKLHSDITSKEQHVVVIRRVHFLQDNEFYDRLVTLCYLSSTTSSQNKSTCTSKTIYPLFLPVSIIPWDKFA